MKNSIVKKLVKTLFVAMLVVTNALYMILTKPMNPVIPVPLYYSALILIVVINIFTLTMYLLNKDIKVIRIIVSSISLAFYLTLIIMFHHDYYAWICACLSLVLLILNIFLKPLHNE